MEMEKAERISEKINSGIKTAISELEELRLQLALGKLEVKELFETNKKKFQQVMHDLENQANHLKEEPEISTVLKGMEHLKLQLALGTAESKQLFEEQYTKILNALNTLDSDLKNNKTISENYAKFHLELAKFKIKLELFALHFKLKKLSVEYDFDKIKSQLQAKLDRFKDEVNAKSKLGKAQWENFHIEIKNVFEHFTSAFKH